MSFSHAWNVLKTLDAFPCAQPNPIIIALTFVPAAAPALFEYAGMTCRDILKAKLGRQAPCGRQLHLKAIKAIPPSAVGVAKTLLKFEAAASRLGNAFLIADLASDTVARWTTLAYQLNGCPDALVGTTWQGEWNAPGTLLPNVPTIIGGSVTHESGTPGVAWPTGCVLPAKWYYSGEFKVEARSLHTGFPVGLQTWVHRVGVSGYDFPADETPAGLPGANVASHTYLKTQNDDEHAPHNYVYMAMSSETAQIVNFTATGQASPIEPNNWALSMLSCFNDLTHKTIKNPAGRNKVSSFPPGTPKFISSAVPRAARGAPGGKPRTKN